MTKSLSVSNDRFWREAVVRILGPSGDRTLAFVCRRIQSTVVSVLIRLRLPLEFSVFQNILPAILHGAAVFRRVPFVFPIDDFERSGLAAHSGLI